MAHALGFCCRTGSAAVVAVAPDGGFAGRWAADLSAPGTPVQLFHAAAHLPATGAERFVRAGVDAVGAVAAAVLRDLVATLGGDVVVAVVTGDHPVPEDTPVARILAVHALMHGAEGQLYRDALLDAAGADGLPTYAVPRGAAEERLAGDLAAAVAGIGAAAGRPWRKEQKLATVAALVASPAPRVPGQ
ncbi:MAG TPA: hypothetical protein VGQ92_12025 [Actinoplanes sp.]|jgi:hypothetical protein|nr:hypothetical protein [Actinoplanes sp.]